MCGCLCVCVCVCVRACVRACVRVCMFLYALRIVSSDKILCLTSGCGCVCMHLE